MLFQELQSDYVKVYGLDFLASIRRLGLITFRIAMILTVLRTFESGDVTNPLVCEDDDFDATINIIRVLFQHTSRVFQTLPKTATADPGHQSTLLKQNFFDALPKQFDRAAYLLVAQRFAIKAKTADKFITKFTKSGKITREAHNQYRKSEK